MVYGPSATFTLWIPPHEQEHFADDLAALSSGSLAARFGITRVVDVGVD